MAQGSVGQASGSAAEVWYKIEYDNGVTPATTVGGGASTTLSDAVNPGETSIVVASDTNIAAGDILRIGNDNNMEFVIVDSTYVSGTTVAIDTNTKINLRHESGEAILEVDPTGDWYRLGNIRSFTPTGGRDLHRSQTLSGTRVLSNFREGNYDAGMDIVAELDLASAGMMFMHALNCDYGTTGVTAAGANTTLSLAGARGDTSIEVTSATGITAGMFLQVGTGSGAEIIKAGTPSGTTIPLDTAYHPNGLRLDHANSEVVDEVTGPYTHTVIRGTNLPAGVSFMLRFADIESIVLIRGGRASNLTLNVDPSDLPTMNMNFVAKAFQILSENIFGTPNSIEHIPYAHWEAKVSVDDTEQVTNQFENLSVVIENTMQGNFVVGSPLKGAITPGEGSVSGSFTYQYETQQFAEKTVAGTETELDFTWTYIGDNNHQVGVYIPKAKFEGQPHPGVGSKDPVTDDKSFLGRLDTVTGTDVRVTVKNNQPTLEYVLESVS